MAHAGLDVGCEVADLDQVVSLLADPVAELARRCEKLSPKGSGACRAA